LNPSLVYERKTGKGRLQKVGEYTMWRNVTDLSTRDSMPNKDGSRYSCATWAQQGYESCNIWDYHAPATSFTFRDVPLSQLPPFKEHKIQNNVKFWAPELLRTVALEFDEKVTVKGVKGRKYKIKEEEVAFTANCTLEPDRCNPKNSLYRMWGPSYTLPMASTTAGTKISLSYPTLGKMLPVYRNQTTGQQWEWSQTKFGSYVVVEPLTGFFIHGHLRLQYDFDLDRRQLTSSLWTNLLDKNPYVTDILYWPQLWFDDTDTIKRKDARSFRKGVYRNRLVALVFAVFLLAVGFASFVFGVVLLCRRRRRSEASWVLDKTNKRPDDFECKDHFDDKL